MAKRYQLPLGGRHPEPRCSGVQSRDADNSPCRALGAPGLPGKWICSLPPWHTPWASREAQTCRECLHWGNRSHSDSGLGLESPGDPRELTQRLCGPVRPPPPSEVFSSCTGNNESTKMPAIPPNSAHSSHSWDQSHAQPAGYWERAEPLLNRRERAGCQQRLLKVGQLGCIKGKQCEKCAWQG